MRKQLKTLVLYRGRFSGVTHSLVHALRSNGCEVSEAKVSLRNLRYRNAYICLIIINALLTYGVKFKKLLDRTSAAFAFFSKANEALLKNHGDIDVIVQIGANFKSRWKDKRRPAIYTLFTDHTNMLSKKTANGIYSVPERHVSKKWNFIEKQIFNDQDHIFVMGPHAKTSIVRDYGIDTNNVSVVGAGPNHDLDIEKDGVKKSFGHRTILFVGKDSQRKGLNLLIRAFEEIVQTFPDARLNIAGVDGTNTSNIAYHGLINGEALKQLFYTAQIFALPTYREPFGIVFIEAMFAKCACIGTRTGAIPEIIEDQKTGFLIDVGDVQALKEKIIYLFSNPAMLKNMAEEGYEIARNKWTWNLVATKMIKKINSLITDKEISFKQNAEAR